MSKVILKWRYFKPQTAIHRERYLKYIATREGVEKVNDGMRNAPPTRAQTRLIKFLICVMKIFMMMMNSHLQIDKCSFLMHFLNIFHNTIQLYFRDL